MAFLTLTEEQMLYKAWLLAPEAERIEFWRRADGRGTASIFEEVMSKYGDLERGPLSSEEQQKLTDILNNKKTSQGERSP